MYYYAQLDDTDIVVVKSQQPKKIIADNMIELLNLHAVQCGQLYNRDTGQFEEV